MQKLFKTLLFVLGVTNLAPSIVADERNIEVTRFDKIFFEGAGTLHLVQGSPISVAVSGDHKLLEKLSVEVSDQVLHIELESERGNVENVHVYVVVETLTEVSSHGKGRVLMNGFEVEDLHLRGIGRGEFLLAALQARELTVESRGATRFEISGTADRQVVELGGAGEYLAQNLATSVGSISIFGAGIGELWVDEWLDVRITGAGSISYRGSPQVAQQVFGFGSVQRLDQL